MNETLDTLEELKYCVLMDDYEQALVLIEGLRVQLKGGQNGP